MTEVTDSDRVAVRRPPNGHPVMHQNWGKLLFMHWRVDPNVLRPLIPPQLDVDIYDNSAWIALAPFTMWDMRPLPPFVPPIPGLSSMHELNVRTYVHHGSVPGVWFFSLDINNAAAALAARKLYHLPYHSADIQLEKDGNRIDYSLRRSNSEASFQATWTIGNPLPVSQPGSREFFLTERYVLYSESDGELYRARVYHEPWPLREANLIELDTNLFEVNKISRPEGSPLVHYAEEVSVDVWYLQRLSRAE